MVFPEREWETAPPEKEGLCKKPFAAAMDVLSRISGKEGTRAAVVIRNGRMIWHGPDIDRPFAIWSCTKSILNMTMGFLVDDGRLSLDTRAADLYPALVKYYPTLTLRHLATFTSGYRPRAASSKEPPFDPAEPLFPPGVKFHYSWDPYVLALILTKAAGEPLRELFRRRIAEPIGLDPTSWHWGDWGPRDDLTGLNGVAVCGGSGVFDRGVTITARALARVAWLWACSGEWNGRRLLSHSWVDASTRPQVSAETPPYDPKAWYARLPGRYGLYWWTNGPDREGRRLWPSAPPHTFAMQGNKNNYAFVIPEWNMTVVRLGSDGQIVNDRYDEFFAALATAVSENIKDENG